MTPKLESKLRDRAADILDAAGAIENVYLDATKDMSAYDQVRALAMVAAFSCVIQPEPEKAVDAFAGAVKGSLKMASLLKQYNDTMELINDNVPTVRDDEPQSQG